jgi:RNA polymerase sigma factor (sigma-70 family)
MTSAERARLVVSLTPVVLQAARRLRRERGQFAGSFDDLISDGHIGALKAVDAFDPANGATLETYAYHRIYGEMRDGLRNRSGVRTLDGEPHRSQPETTSMDAMLEQAAWKEPAAAGDPFEKTNRDLTVRSILQRLPLGERLFLEDYFLRGHSGVEIAKWHGVTGSRVSGFLARAMDDARKVATNPDLDLSGTSGPQWAVRHVRVSPSTREARADGSAAPVRPGPAGQVPPRAPRPGRAPRGAGGDASVGDLPGGAGGSGGRPPGSALGGRPRDAGRVLGR